MPSLRSLRRTYKDDHDDLFANIPRLKSTIGARGALPAQIMFWKPWTPSGKLVAQVLRDIQRDTPNEMQYIVCWRYNWGLYTMVPKVGLAFFGDGLGRVTR